MDKSYYYEEGLESLEGCCTVYNEFTGQVETRRITICQGKVYTDSSRQDYDRKNPFPLYDGLKSELDLSHAKEISAEEFEKAWKEARSGRML